MYPHGGHKLAGRLVRLQDHHFPHLHDDLCSGAWCGNFHKAPLLFTVLFDKGKGMPTLVDFFVHSWVFIISSSSRGFLISFRLIYILYSFLYRITLDLRYSRWTAIFTPFPILCPHCNYAFVLFYAVRPPDYVAFL